MAGLVIFEERVEIPMGVRSLAEFRRWALSDDFPKQVSAIGGLRLRFSA